jgi:hypothetical protein
MQRVVVGSPATPVGAPESGATPHLDLRATLRGRFTQ